MRQDRAVDAHSFQARLRELRQAHARRTDNVGCIGCTRCERSTDSTFCEDSAGLVRCHYVVRSSQCTDCSHCEGCVDCLSCSQCEDCERCTASAYLERSVGCTRCTYCFGCVGLIGKDFHILNEPYDRETYFAVVRELRRGLGSERRR